MRSTTRSKRLATIGLILVLLVLTIVCVPGAPVWAAASDFKNQAVINFNTAPTEYCQLELSDTVLSQTREGWPDLRIYSGQDEVPYALLTDASSISQIQTERAGLLNRGTDAAGNLQFEIENLASTWISQLQLINQSRDFIRQVRVEGSRDQASWLILTDDSTIFDLSAEQKSRHTEVAFTPTNFTYLRVTIFKDGKGEFQLDGVDITLVTPRSQSVQEKERPFELKSETGPSGEQIFTFDLAGPLPTREIELITSEKNFNRDVELSSSADGQTWSLISNNEIFVYQLDKLSAAQLKLPFRAQARYLKLRIINQDNPALKIDAFKIRGSNPVVVFPAAPNKPFTLYWNNEQLASPVYDLAKFVENLDYDAMTRATLGPAENNPGYQFVDSRPWTERNAWLLQAMMVLLVAILLVAIIWNIRKIATNKE